MPTILTRLSDGDWHDHGERGPCPAGWSLAGWIDPDDTDPCIEVGEDH